MPARLTSIITLYNSARTVAETVRSLQAQTFEDWECVVVNDGSTDGGPAIIEALAAAEPRLRMVSQSNQGLPGARNRGIDECRTELVHFLDSDDWMTTRGLEWLVGAAAETGSSYGGYELCDDHGRSLGRQSSISAPLVGLDEQLEWNRTQTHAHLFSRAAIGDCRFNPRFKVVEDYDMWLRLAIRGERWKAVERIVARYRVRPNSMSKRFDAMAECYQAAVQAAFAEAPAFGWCGRVDLDETRFRRVVGTQALAFATMEALGERGPDKGRAAAIMRRAARPDRFEPGWVANAANVALLFGGAAEPGVDGYADPAVLASLRHWWSRGTDEGWLDPARADETLSEFSRKVIHPDEVVEALLGDIRLHPGQPAPTVGVIGLEKNGRRLLRAAAARGLRVAAFDNFSDQRELDLLLPEERREWGGRVTILRDPAAFVLAASSGSGADEHPAPCLVAPIDPVSLVAAHRTLAGMDSSPVIYWATARDRIGVMNRERIDRAMDYRPAKAG